jgi:hypothetical protein
MAGAAIGPVRSWLAAVASGPLARNANSICPEIPLAPLVQGLARLPLTTQTGSAALNNAAGGTKERRHLMKA